MTMLDEQITLSLYQAVPLAPDLAPAIEMPTLAETLLLGLGGFGGDTALRTLGLCALQGAVPVVGTLDNAASSRVDPTLPDGRAASALLPPQAHCYLDSG